MPATPYAASASDTPIASAKRPKRRAQPLSSSVRRGDLYADGTSKGADKSNSKGEDAGGATSLGSEDSDVTREGDKGSEGPESPSSPKARKSSPSSTPRKSGVNAAERQNSGSTSKSTPSNTRLSTDNSEGGVSPSEGGGRLSSGGGDGGEKEDINRHRAKESSLFSPALHPEHLEEEDKGSPSTKNAQEDTDPSPIKDATTHAQESNSGAAGSEEGEAAKDLEGGEDGVAAEGEGEEDEDEEEFNPYCFIAHLPPYNSVKHHTPEAPALPEKRKTRHGKELTLVLDLDETLVHCTVDPIVNPDHSFEVHFNGEEFQVYVRKRPHLDAFLEAVSELFEVVVFTASQRVYAERLLNMIDPQKKFVKYRLYRDACMALEGNYLKDLNVLGRDLSKVAIVDNSPYAYGFQIDNGIPIESWFDDTSDEELLHLLPLLKQLISQSEIAGGDVRPFIRNIFKTHELVDKARNGSLLDNKSVESPTPPSAAEAAARAQSSVPSAPLPSKPSAQ